MVVKKPWGQYEVLEHKVEGRENIDRDEGPLYVVPDYPRIPAQVVKRITINPGQRISLQRHKKRCEHWFIVKGIGVVTIRGFELNTKAGRSHDIFEYDWHRIANTGTEPLVLIEVQYGSVCSEDDIERKEDDYGRV